MLRLITCLLFFPLLAGAGEPDIPKCVGEICFGGKGLPARKELANFLGVDELEFQNKEAACLKTKSRHFLVVRFFEHGMPKENIEQVTLAKNNICKGLPLIKNIISDLKLDSKIGIGSSYKEVTKAYGKPIFHQTGEKLKQYQIDKNTKSIVTDEVLRYGSKDPNSLLSSAIFLKNKKVVAFEVGESE